MPSNPAVRDAIAKLVRSLSDLQSDSIESITQAAVQAVPGADYASITIANPDRTLTTIAATDPLVVQLDDLQQELQEGPCLAAALHDRGYVSDDIRNDVRWPRYGPAAAELGVGSQIGLDLHHPDDAHASLNLYSTATGKFNDVFDIADLFATHASLALGFATATNHYEAALRSRKTIGQALGIVMERYGLDEDRAFKFLTRTSAQSNVKLREVAADIVAGVNRRNQPDPQD